MRVASATRLDATSLRSQAARRLRAHIITGEIRPGRLYTIGEFAEQFGVSATPVREALGDLAAAGLVQVVRNRGFIVPVLTEQDLDEIFQLRLLLEVPAVARVAGKLSLEQVEACRGFVTSGREMAESGDTAGFLESDRQFHLSLLGATGNMRLVQIIDRLRDEARLYGLLALGDGALIATSAEEHDALLRAIEMGDVGAARRQMTQHLRHTRGAWAGYEESIGDWPTASDDDV